MIFAESAQRQRRGASAFRPIAAGHVGDGEQRSPIIGRAIMKGVGNIRVGLTERIAEICRPARAALRQRLEQSGRLLSGVALFARLRSGRPIGMRIERSSIVPGKRPMAAIATGAKVANSRGS